MDLIRGMLLWMEQSDDRIFYLNGFKVFRDSEDVTLFHLHLLVSAGFVEKPREHSFMVTWEGHEFLDKIRDEEIWRKTKDKAEKVGSWSVKLLGELASGIIRAKATELGLPLA